MPLFRNSRSHSPETPSTFFGKSTSPSSDPHSRSNSFFRRGRQSSSDSDNTHHFTLHRRIRGTSEPSILAARQKVTDAEGAEKEADKALHAARMAVDEARKHVKNLEREAAEE